MQSISVFLDIGVSHKKVCHLIQIFFDLLQVRYKYAKFHHFRIRVIDFRQEDLFTPHSKRPILNSVKEELTCTYLRLICFYVTSMQLVKLEQTINNRKRFNRSNIYCYPSELLSPSWKKEKKSTTKKALYILGNETLWL